MYAPDKARLAETMVMTPFMIVIVFALASKVKMPRRNVSSPFSAIESGNAVAVVAAAAPRSRPRGTRAGISEASSAAGLLALAGKEGPQSRKEAKEVLEVAASACARGAPLSTLNPGEAGGSKPGEDAKEVLEVAPGAGARGWLMGMLPSDGAEGSKPKKDAMEMPDVAACARAGPRARAPQGTPRVAADGNVAVARLPRGTPRAASIAGVPVTRLPSPGPSSVASLMGMLRVAGRGGKSQVRAAGTAGASPRLAAADDS